MCLNSQANHEPARSDLLTGTKPRTHLTNSGPGRPISGTRRSRYGMREVYEALPRDYRRKEDKLHPARK
jgi:hypothetical protein